MHVLQVVALEPRYASRKTREFVTGDVRGRLKLSSQVSHPQCFCAAPVPVPLYTMGPIRFVELLLLSPTTC